jgi:uncharacterized protein (DUF1501 family)
MAGGRVGNLVFGEAQAATSAAATSEIFVMIFLRGGCDALSLLPPFADPIYVQSRQSIKVPDTGQGAAIPLNAQNGTFTNGIGLHPKGGPLKELYDAGHLAFVHACGLNDDTRSHFDAMDYIERGTPGNKSTSSGWLTRHLQVVGEGGTLPTLSADSATPSSLLADGNAVAMTDLNSYELSGPWRYNNLGGTGGDGMLKSLKQIYAGAGAIQAAGQRTIEAIETINALKTANGGKDLVYTPAPGLLYPYPDHSFGESLMLVAQTIKLDLGLRVATLDFGGWDTHEHEGVIGGYFDKQVDVLARGLNAFYNDLASYQSRLTVVVMSEFGRRLGENTGGGTDHGHGGVMLALGGNVNGGKVYGKWPGLLDLDQNEDLKTTTDYRKVLGEIVVRRLGDAKLGTVFPGITPDVYSPATKLGVVSGPEPAIDYTPPMRQFYLPFARR